MEPTNNIKKELDKLKDNSQFNIPGDYFEKLPGNIMDKIKQNETRLKNPGIIRRLKPYLAVAASIAAIILIAYPVMDMVKKKNSNYIPEDEIMLALESEIYYLDESFMLNMMEDNSILNVYDIELSDEDIIKYLTENGSDLDYLEVEF